MRKIIIAAAILLLFQLALTAIMNIGGNRISATPETAFLGINPAKVSSLEIFGNEGERLLLEKKDGAWILPGTSGATADSQQITSLLDSLDGLKQGFVVAVSDEAAKRFKVADDTFLRHILVKEDHNTVADFYLGTSPGFRQVHARRAGQKDIVTVGLSTYELETKADKWLDKGVLKIASDEISEIAYADFSLKRKKGDNKTDDTWQLNGNDAGTPDMKEARDLVERIALLTVDTVLDPSESGKMAATAPGFQFTVKKKDGAVLHYSLNKIDGDAFALKRSDKELMFKLSGVAVKDLEQFSRARLLGRKTTDNIVTPGETTTPAEPAVPDTPTAAEVAPQN